MAIPDKNGKDDAHERLHDLERENEELRKQLRKTQEERDGYLNMVHTWAKVYIGTDELKRWEQDEPSDGRTILDVIEEVRRESA